MRSSSLILGALVTIRWRCHGVSKLVESLDHPVEIFTRLFLQARE
jgi:hypothetical protein